MGSLKTEVVRNGLSREASGTGDSAWRRGWPLVKRTKEGSRHVEETVSSKKTLLADLCRLYTSSRNHDLVIEVVNGPEWTEIRAHRLVLAARCRLLRDKIEAEAKRRGRDEEIRWRWTHISPAIAKSVVQFFYTGILSLNDSIVFDVWNFAIRIGADSVADVAKNHVFSQMGTRNCLQYLAKSLEFPHLGVHYEGLMQFIRRHAHLIVGNSQFVRLPPHMLRRVLEEDELSCSEDQIWRSLLAWGVVSCGFRGKEYSDLDEVEKTSVHEAVRPFSQPGMVRHYDISPALFAEEIEQTGVYSREEIVEKYRYDVILSYASISELYRPRVDISSRVRRRIVVVESEHPHTVGAIPQVTKSLVEMPSWCREVTVTFDMQSELGSYADLCIYLDGDEKNKVFSFYYFRREQQNTGDMESKMKFVVPKRRFWYTFYSPANFKPGWGYRFECTISKSDFDVPETAIDVMSRRNLYEVP